MTTLAVRTRNSDLRGGFTLLEIMFAIGLIAMMITMVFVSFKPDGAGPVLNEAVTELEALSARGHAMSVLHQKPFWLSFEQNRVALKGATLEEVSMASPEEEAMMERVGIPPQEGVSNIVEYGSYAPKSEVQLFVRRWGAKANAWFRPEMPEDPPIIWNFEPNGLCEPITIRLELENSWVEFEMDPLTGFIADERSEIND